MFQKFTSNLLEEAVEQLALLPGTGRKTALRLALHLLKQNKERTFDICNALVQMRTKIKHCAKCHNICDDELCPICKDARRDTKTICVVENIQDVMVVEQTRQFNGLYHVLGGLISPVDGVGYRDLEIESLEKRIETEDVNEVILALSSTMEGETTTFFITKRLKDKGVKLSEIAKGVSVGDELSYADEVTLGQAIINRVAVKGQ